MFSFKEKTHLRRTPTHTCTQAHLRMRAACVRVCVRACVCACVSACVRAFARARARAYGCVRSRARV